MKNATIGISDASLLKVEVRTDYSTDGHLQSAMEVIDLDSRLAHPFQTEPFAALFNTDPARTPFLVTASDGDELVAYWWGYFAQYRGGIWPRSHAWVRSGPVIRGDLVDRRDEPMTAMVRALKQYVRSQRVGWIIFTSEALWSESCEAAVHAEGFCRHDLQTYVIDLSLSEQEITTRLREQARRAANRARQAGVVVEDASADEDILAYYDIYLDNGSAPGYWPPSPETFVERFQRLRNHGKARLIVARHGPKGPVLAGSFFPCHGGIAAQHQHAVSAEARRLHAGSLLIWESILSFKQAGFRMLDLVSVDVAPPEGSREAGVRHFKSGWGGALIDTPVYQYWSPGLRMLRSLTRRVRSLRESHSRSAS